MSALPDDAARRGPARLAFAAALALLCAGMAIAIAGVVVPGLFLPGVVAIDLGMLACVAAAILHLGTAPRPAVPSKRAR